MVNIKLNFWDTALKIILNESENRIENTKYSKK